MSSAGLPDPSHPNQFKTIVQNHTEPEIGTSRVAKLTRWIKVHSANKSSALFQELVQPADTCGEDLLFCDRSRQPHDRSKPLAKGGECWYYRPNGDLAGVRIVLIQKKPGESQ
jgi:hypothetical protein